MSTEGRHRDLAGIRVLVVDDHDLFRTGLVSLLSAQPDIEVVGQASSAGKALRLARDLRPEVIVMDLRLPDLDGTEVTRTILGEQPNARVLALTAVASEAAVLGALDAGACGFVSKETPVEGVVDAIRAAAGGAAWLSPHAANLVLARIRDQESDPEADPELLQRLSTREIEVLRLVARGMDNGQIAQVLNISPRTAKNHVSSILAKLGLPSRVHAAIYAVRGGLS